MKYYKFIINAPFINTGGGKLLLFQVIGSLNDNSSTLLIVDKRINIVDFKFKYIKTISTSPNFFSYLINEAHIFLKSSAKTQILCLHGAPVFFKNPGTVIIFFHNKLHLLYKFNLFAPIKYIKNFFFTSSFYFADKIIVQSDSMLYILEKFLREKSVNIQVIKKPFLNKTYVKQIITRSKIYDFVYVADASEHKNHTRLIEAWVLLAKENIRPSLVLTIPASQYLIFNKFNNLIKNYKLRIYNFSDLSYDEVHLMYSKSKALIYPSLVESFGLPLLESSSHNLTILASELDFVRDVCEPDYTFNPMSATSIASSVKRYLKIPFRASKVISANSFIKSIFNNYKT